MFRQRGSARGLLRYLQLWSGALRKYPNCASGLLPSLDDVEQAVHASDVVEEVIVCGVRLQEVVFDRVKDSAGDALAGLSYDRLRPYRDELTRALYSKIQTGVESPQAFAAYARSLKIMPAPGALLHTNDLLVTFVRDVLLTGNGTLFVNNTFVEWAAVQALRRAQPRVLVTRFGVRDKLKPFSSLLLFSQPRASDQIPRIEDPVGSFIDVEQLPYYVWLNAENS